MVDKIILLIKGKKHMSTIKFKVGRDAKNGRFITIEKARQRKSTAIVETIKVNKKK